MFKGNILDMVFELRCKLVTILGAQGEINLLLTVTGSCFGTQLAYLVDAFELLNSPNGKLQDKVSNIKRTVY